MKILIVCSGNVVDFDFKLHQAFVYEQIESVKEFYQIQYDTFFIKGKGFTGYIGNLSELKKKIDLFKPDIVHAHFGLSGLLSVLQRKIPVIITYHGSDVAFPIVRFFSKFAAALSHFNIFVSSKIQAKLSTTKKNSIIPCGINLGNFYPIKMIIAREKLGLDLKKKIILFAAGFDNAVKNSPLAFSAIKLLDNPVDFLELKNKSREEVNLMLNACDLLLLTSTSEGSPQIIKEAMACNCPIVATDVGDIKNVIKDTDGCYITSFDPDDVAEKIKLALVFNNRTQGREKIKRFDNKIIAKQIYDIYKLVIR